VIVGLPDAAVKESKDRVRTAIINWGYKPHIGRTTINLAPADIKKEVPSSICRSRSACSPRRRRSIVNGSSTWPSWEFALSGGTHPVPGEVSLAHHGVLFLDELPEFHRNVLEVLRQPLEDGTVTVARAAATVTFPCRFMLVAAMNPCPCGYFGDTSRECRGTDHNIQTYRNKISGPLLDRIDIHIEVPTIRYQELSSMGKGELSTAIRERVIAARRRQVERFGGRSRIHSNAAMNAKQIQEHCRLQPEAQDLLKMAITELNFGARAYDRILKGSRTIADLASSEEITSEHVREAVQYRTLDRQLWV
jgi:magnesium chelatase family protein